MTISTTPSEVSYATDGVTTSFPIPFVFGTADDLKVVLTDAGGNVTEVTTGFTTTGGNGSTGTLVFASAPAVNQTLTILDDPEIKQATDYVSNDAFPAESHEEALDYLTRLVKRLSQQNSRALRTRDGDPLSGDDLILPSVQNRASRLMAFDADGKPEPAAAVDVPIEALTRSLIGELLHPRTPAEIAAGVTPIDYAYEPISVRRFVTGGAGTSASPFIVSTASLQALINVVSNTCFVFDPGYWYEIEEITVTSAGRSSDPTLGGVYRAGIYFIAHGSTVKLAAGNARAITFTDVSDFGVIGGFWTGSPSEAFWKVNSTGTPIRGFTIQPDRVKGGATSGNGTDGVGLLLDSSSANIAGFYIGGGRGTMWTHVKDGIYMKNTAPGSGIDTGLIENITCWPYGTDAAAGYTIRCEAAVDVVFRRIYGGLFEHDSAAAIYLQPTYLEGIKNCRFEVISADVSNSRTSCQAIRALVNDSNKPIEGCTFDQVKIYRAATGTAGNNAIAVTTTNNAEFRHNLIAGIWSNDTATAKAVVLGQYSHNNCIIPTGNIDTADVTAWISDAGYRNVITGLNPAMLASANGRTTVTAGGTTSVKAYTLRGGTLGPSDAIRISINGTIATNANGVTIAVMFGSSTVATSTISGGATGVFRIEVEIANQGSTSSQRWHSRMFRHTALISHGAGAITEDTTNDLTIRVDVTLAEPPGSDTVNVDSRNVELLNAPLS